MVDATEPTLTGFYPEAGTKEFDIYGQALVLATRYKGMRKTLFEAEKGKSVLIIQSVVCDSLDPSHREGFIELDIKEKGIVVRDDPAAIRETSEDSLYFERAQMAGSAIIKGFKVISVPAYKLYQRAIDAKV